MKLFSNFYIPIEINKITNKEYKNIQVVHDVNEAKEIAKNMAMKELDEKIEDKNSILDKQITIHEDSSYVEVEVTYEVQENIGTKEKIVF